MDIKDEQINSIEKTLNAIMENQIAIMCTLAALNAASVRDGTIVREVIFESMKGMLNNAIGETSQRLEATQE